MVIFNNYSSAEKYEGEKMGVYDKEPYILIKKTAEELKKNKLVEMPEWAKFVKTGHHKERHPIEKDWWYIRAASVLRKLYINSKPIGVNRLRKVYGGKKNRGYKPERFYKASGKIIRVILQQLEKSKLIKQTEKGVHKGRVISPEGQKFLNKIAKEV